MLETCIVCGHPKGEHGVNPPHPCGHAYSSSAVKTCICSGFRTASEPDKRDWPAAETVEFENVDEYMFFRELYIAFKIYQKRDRERRGGWRRAGVKGATNNIFGKAERAFIQVMNGEVPNPDHYRDLINYAVFALLLGDDLEGSWPWPRA